MSTSSDARQLARDTLAGNTASTRLDALGFAGLEQLCRRVSGVHAPHRSARHEARDGFPIVDSETRALRLALPDGACVVCENQTCPAVDQRELPHGDLAWLTPNLYPITFPFDDAANAANADTRGVHLVHWSSLQHRGGLAGADAATAAALFSQLADVERFLLHEAPAHYPDTGDGHRGYVSTIKNRGRRVGGSVEHDHQQILLSALAPGEPPRARELAQRLRTDTPGELVVQSLDGLASVLVPTFMRRPLHAFVAPATPGVGHLHHMPSEERDACALLVARLCAALDALMTASHGEPAWNLICHTGAGIGPLFELRPFTQPLGGYEHLGLYLCEESPQRSAARLRDAFAAH
ncbi:MAG: hypothetical protein DHS20C15_10830 [Planctomycetota bacterium]|nr:MAG: hypothetical protein DHS20C15_10830 [Planctomycetota bacterium]